jgi:ribonuclease E
VPVPTEPEPRVEEAPPALVASAPEVVREEPQSPAPVSEPEPVVQPGRADPASILASLKSGTSELLQIETDPHKVQPVVEEEEAPRQPRVRRPRPAISDEPLVQVETRRRELAEEALPHA